MQRMGVWLAAAALVAACSDEPSAPTGPVDMFEAVDPFIGTGGLGFGVGSTYPGPALPFAMIHAGPDTRAPSGAPGFNHCAGYWYEDDYIEAFSLLRMHGTGLPDYGVIGIMPVDGMTGDRTDEPGYAAAFDHADEQAEPGYYRVTLDSGIDVEITTARRAAMFRFTFPDDVDPTVLLDFEHTIGEGVSTDGEVSVTDGGAVSGWMHNLGAFSDRFGGFPVYAAAEVSPAPMAVGVWDEAGLHAGAGAATGVDVGAWLQFAPGTREVVMRVGVSFVDADGAAGNLAAEIADFDFDRIRADAAALWRDELAAVTLEGASERDAVMVATALYHSLLMPTLMSDVDGRYRAVDGSIATADHDRYSDFSLWDTYRTLHPWLLLIEDARNRDFALSMLGFANEGGALPKWSLAHRDTHSMVGSPADMVMAESAAKGVAFDEAAALDFAWVTANDVSPGPIGGRGAAIADYVSLGYVPADRYGGAVAETLEYAIADAALADWAARLGRDDDAAVLAERAGSWRNILHPDDGFFRPRNADGTWAAWTGPLQMHDAYTEGNAWQYLWLVPHDLDGLAEALGGREVMLGKLRELFDASVDEVPSLGLREYYWHGNEPDIMAPWIFAALGEPAEAVTWIDWVVTEHYGTGPDGLPGNDDGGTMSAWLLFAAAGVYPIAGTDRYIVAAPRQSLMVLHRPGGDLRIEAEPDPRTHPIPVRVTLDGVELTGTEITHDQLVGARVLRFEMAAE